MSNRFGAANSVGSSSKRSETLGTLHPHAWAIVVPDAVLEQVLRYSEHYRHQETGGFLVGQPVLQSPARVEVNHFLPAEATRSGATSLAFTHETWATMTRQMQNRFTGEKVVGWHHTHPGLGAFLSANDVFIHRHFFAASWQVALVVDPCRQEFAFFQWHESQITDCGFVRTAS